MNYGQDTFQFTLNQHMGNDVIGDMNVGHMVKGTDYDILKFTGVGSTSVSAVDHMIKSFTDDGSGHLLVTFKAGGSIDFADIAFNHQTSIIQVTPHVVVV